MKWKNFLNTIKKKNKKYIVGNKFGEIAGSSPLSSGLRVTTLKIYIYIYIAIVLWNNIFWDAKNDEEIYRKKILLKKKRKINRIM